MKDSVPFKSTKKTHSLNAFYVAVIAMIANFLMTSTASAHPGHNHASNESMLMHVLFYGSIVVAITACVWFAYRQVTKQKNK